MLGAFVAMLDMLQVFTLNMTYDVPVKLFSFQLLLMAVFLLAPDARRISNLFLLNRPVEPSEQLPLFGSRRANRIALAVQVAFGVFLLAGNLYGASQSWYAYGGGRPKSPLYGIWSIAAAQPGPGATPVAWRRIIFDFPASMTVQNADDSFSSYRAAIDVNAQAISLTRRGPAGRLTYQRTGNDQLILAGEIDGQRVELHTHLLDPAKLLLVSRGFHWIQEYPYNR